MPHLTESSLQVSKETNTIIKDLFLLALQLAFYNKQSVATSGSSLSFCDSEERNVNKRTLVTKRTSCEIFLGGSCNPTTWRKDIAIPALQNLGITYYNPQVAHWYPELIAQEHEAKEMARVLLFVIDEQTRNCAGVIEAAQLAGSRPDALVLVLKSYSRGQSILGEPLSPREFRDLANSLLILRYLAARQRIPVFESVTAALGCASKIVRNAESKNSTTQSLRQKLKQAFDSFDRQDQGSILISEAMSILRNHGERNISVTELRNFINEPNGNRNKADVTEQRVTFEQLCTLASERDHINDDGSPDPDAKDLYFGVTGDEAAWVDSSAAPLLHSLGLSYHRTGTKELTARALPVELRRLQSSKVVLLSVGTRTRGLSLMALAAHLIGLRTELILCIQSLSEDVDLCGEKLTEQACKDYNRGRSYLSDMAKREGVPVFDDVDEALEKAIQVAQKRR